MKDADQNEMLETAERFQRLFVTPIVDAVRVEMKTQFGEIHKAQASTQSMVDAHEMTINELKGKQTKALVGWGVYATIAAGAIGAAWGWIKSKLHWG